MSSFFPRNQTELVLANTTTNPGRIVLPSTFLAPGRVMSVKDITGAFQTNRITISTINQAQLFEQSALNMNFNDRFGSYTFTAGNDNRWYVTGGNYMNAATISSITTRATSTFFLSTANATVSSLTLKDISNPSTATIANSSGYLLYSLSNFWGGTKTGVPVFLPLRRPFVPTQVSGSILWLDASDPATFLGGPIWIDKSGTRNNATNGFPGYSSPPAVTTINGLNAAQFLAARLTSMRTTNVIPAFSVTYFMVLRVTGVSAGPVQIFAFINNTDGQRQLQIFNASVPANTFPTALYYITNSAAPNLITSALSQSQVVMVCMTVPSSTAGFAYSYLNGSIAPTTSQTPLYNTPATANSIHYIGSSNPNPTNPTGHLSGDIGEFIIYNTELTQLQRSQVEGYLAWKWGIVGNLPSNHPFKNSPP
jgi:hypothetical protein